MKVAEVRRDVAWFPRQLQHRRITADAPPRPLLSAIREDVDGLLWVLLRREDEHWRYGVEPAGRDHVRVTEQHRYRDSMIEVLGSGYNGRLVAAKRLDQVVWFVGERLAAYVELDRASVPRVYVVALALDKCKGASYFPRKNTD